MDPTVIETIASYGPWGFSAALLCINWFVMRKLLESMYTYNATLMEKFEKNSTVMASVGDKIEELTYEIRSLECIKKKEGRR